MELKNSLQIFSPCFIILLTCCCINVSGSAMYTPDGRFLFGGYDNETTPTKYVATYGECILEESPFPNQPSPQLMECNVNNCQTSGYLKAGSTTLPIGSTAYITNSENKKVIQVAITHEGPINPRVVGRIAELSAESFCCLAGIDQKVFPCYVSLTA